MEFTSDAIAEYAIELSSDQLTNEAVEAAKRLTLDSLSCCLGAYASPPSEYLRSTYGSLDGADQAAVFGSGEQTLLEYAGLINSTMVRYLDYNDTYISEGRACHPSDHIPALISVAEAEEATGEALVNAIVLAYEIEGAGLDTGATWDPGYDYVTWGAYSTVAAVGTLMDLSRDELISALGIVGSSNLTLSVSRKGAVSMWKGVAHPYVTHNAIQACQMARAGLTGPEQVFEGPGGFFDVVSGRKLRLNRLGGQDGAPYRITQAHIKPFPCGYYMQPIIAGVRDLVVENDLDSESIVAIDIETFNEAATILGGEEKWSTDLTRESADHSIPYTAALAVLYGDVTPDHYNNEYRADPAVHDLMERVTVEESDAMNSAATDDPQSTPSLIRITAADETYERRVDYAPGHAQNPLTKQEIEDKARDMMEPLLDETKIETVIQFCEELPDRSGVGPLVKALTI